MFKVRAAVHCVLGANRRSLQSRAFKSTHASDAWFQMPSFPMPEDPSLWQDKYPRADPSYLWKVGSFPMQNEQDEAEENDGALACSEDLWDTSGMLSALHDNLPLRDMDGSSVVKKRRKKMNKHKHRKRKKALRMRTKKN
ncbi:unnamed protein product [Peronospora destructor]|uniref:Ribosomal protein mS38 C-terminal domain-containing protein n=1 Tax=Peronospora destructor TaxID=86335 RepID=A0AAV0VH46_9STRA|nr:unnamed protein product [Peronospora destructor]